MYSKKDNLLTVAEAAHLLGLKRQSVRVLLMKRQLGFVKCGLSTMIPAAEIDRVLALRVKRTEFPATADYKTRAANG